MCCQASISCPVANQFVAAMLHACPVDAWPTAVWVTAACSHRRVERACFREEAMVFAGAAFIRS